VKFSSENLADVVAEIERHYNIAIELRPSQLIKIYRILPTDNIDML
jgi:hypothetical protein